MELSLNALVELLDDHFFARASHDFRAAAGLPPDGPAPEVPEELTRKEVFDATAELASSPRTDEGKRGRLMLLQRYVAKARVASEASVARRALDEAMRGSSLVSGGRTYRLDEALRELPRLASRDTRVTLEHDLSLHLSAAEGPWARWVDRVREAGVELEAPLSKLVELLHGRAVPPRLEGARRLLAETRDAAIDLAGFALKRVDPLLSVKTARRHDLERACLAPWHFESFRREDLEHAVTRCLGDLGFNPSAGGRLTVDAEARPGRWPGAHAFALRAPDQVRLVLNVDLGFEAYAAWLEAWGVALHRANVARTLPVVERRLGDPTVVGGVGKLFQSFLLEEAWLKRYLRLGSAAAREASRMFAFRQLMQLRCAAAQALSDAELWDRGPGGAFLDESRERNLDACLVDGPRFATLLPEDLLGAALLELDEWALETVLHGHLRGRFNEDYFRNPAAGRWLTELAAKGQREDAPTVAKGLPDLEGASDEGALDLQRSGQRRVERMAA